MLNTLKNIIKTIGMWSYNINFFVLNLGKESSAFVSSLSALLLLSFLFCLLLRHFFLLLFFFFFFFFYYCYFVFPSLFYYNSISAITLAKLSCTWLSYGFANEVSSIAIDAFSYSGSLFWFTPSSRS